MKTIIIYTVFLGAILLTEFSNAHTLIQNEPEQTKTFSVSKGGKLDVNVNPGEIKIFAWEKNEVVVKFRGLDKDELDNVDISLSGNTVYVKYNPEWGWGEDLEFNITVPTQFDIVTKSSGGDIDVVADIKGDVFLNTMGGDISSKNILGTAKLSTQGGDVKVGNVNENLTVNTMGGDISTGDVKGGFTKLNTMGGDIKVGRVSSKIDASTYGGDINISGIGGDAEVKTMGGSIDIKDVKGDVNMETSGGNLRVVNASGSIKAQTYAGEIELIGVSGSVDAKTMSGNISAELNPNSGSSSKLISQNGDVYLRLPSNVKASIQAEIKSWTNWKHSKNSYKINSDFPESKTSDSEDERNIRKYYSVNGGGGKIFIQTNNGDINISKK